MNKSGVYKIKNLINNKVYIGSSFNTSERWGDHLYSLKKNTHVNRYLQRAFNKHGEKSYKFEVIETCSNEKLIGREQYWMDYYKSYQRRYGYNLSPTAGSCLGVKHTDEAKLNMSKAKKGVPLSDEAKQNMRKPKSDKAKLNMSKASKGKPKSEEHRRNSSLAHIGKLVGYKHTDGARQNMRKPKSEEHIQKVAKANTGRKHTDEARLNMSLAHIGKKYKVKI